MKFKIIFYSLIFAALGFCANMKAASSVTVKASLDSVNLEMGRMTTLHLEVSQPKGVKGQFPLLSKINEMGIIPICGDSVELRSPSKIDTVDNGNLLNIKYDVPVQAFDSGYYKLPEFVYVSGNDSVKSNSVGLKVYPVNVTADTPIKPYAGIAEPEGANIFDAVPSWMTDLWWLWIIVVLAIFAFIYTFRKYRKDGYIIPKKPEPTPYEVATMSLRDLKAKKLWEQGLEKEYFTELTDILREYLYRRFGINAMEMTSRQILASLKANKELKDKRQYFRQILGMADFVKFAKVRPLPDDNVAAFDNAVKFVEETKPVPVEETDSQIKNAGKGGKK